MVSLRYISSQPWTEEIRMHHRKHLKNIISKNGNKNVSMWRVGKPYKFPPQCHIGKTFEPIPLDVRIVNVEVQKWWCRLHSYTTALCKYYGATSPPWLPPRCMDLAYLGHHGFQLACARNGPANKKKRLKKRYQRETVQLLNRVQASVPNTS